MKIFEILSSEEFKNLRREPLLGYAIYIDVAADLAMRIPRTTRNLADADWMADKNDAAAMSMSRARAWYAADLLALSYSAGVAIDHLKSFYPFALRCWEEFAKYDKAFDDGPESAGAIVAHFGLRGDDFDRVNRMVCFGILLGHAESLPRLASILDYRNSRMDGMLERIMAPFVHGRSAPPDQCTRPLPYSKTLKIFSAPHDARAPLIREYLEEWYGASREEPYYGSHQRDISFVGYWSWEAAAITFLLGVDQANYKSMVYYPEDLVDFARANHCPLSLQEI